MARGTRAVARQNCSVGNTEVPLQVRGTAREEGNEPAADLEDAKQARGSRQGAQREQCRRRCAGTVGLLRIFKSCLFFGTRDKPQCLTRSKPWVWFMRSIGHCDLHVRPIISCRQFSGHSWICNGIAHSRMGVQVMEVDCSKLPESKLADIRKKFDSMQVSRLNLDLARCMPCALRRASFASGLWHTISVLPCPMAGVSWLIYPIRQSRRAS